MLDQLGLAAGRKINPRVVGDNIMLEPGDKPHPRAGWAEAAEGLIDAPVDEIWLTAENAFDDEEWDW